jgi:hypothetical protein
MMKNFNHCCDGGACGGFGVKRDTGQNGTKRDIFYFMSRRDN